MSNVEVYGIGYNPQPIINSLISPKRHYPIMLVTTMTPTQIKAEVQKRIKENSPSKCPVILAGSLDIAQTYLSQFPDQKAKILLFEYPSLLQPFSGECIRWLDCDHQTGGAWQIAKIKPEDLNDLLDTLKPLSPKGRSFLLGMQRYVPKDRVNEIEGFANNLPKYYKDLVASVTEADKSPLKAMKEARKSRDNLRSLISDSLEAIDNGELRRKLVNLVLEYQLAMIAKREFLNKLVLITREESIKKDFLNIRKWVDSKAGAALAEAYFDFVVNKEKRSWQTIIDTHKKVHEEDLLMLLSFILLEGEALQRFSDRVDSSLKLPSDKQVVKAPFHPPLTALGELFNY